MSIHHNTWTIIDFDYGNIKCEMIEFQINNIEYVMIFTRVDEAQDQETIGYKENDLNIDIKKNSYQVKFDLKDNFENDVYFKVPQDKLSFIHIKQLGKLLIELLYYHYEHSKADGYFFTAENAKLKRFYDHLAEQHKNILLFKVLKDLGDEGHGYALTI